MTLPGFLKEGLARHLEVFAPRPDFVFTASESGPSTDNFRLRVWLPAVEASGIDRPWPRVHDLRHTSVALAIAAGAHPKEIQARAGHSGIMVTMDRYGHLFAGMDEALALRLDELRDRSEIAVNGG